MSIGLMGRLAELAERYRVLRAVQFGVAGVIGFLVAEGVIVGGLYLAFGSLQVPSGSFASPALLATDVVAFLVGVTVGFFVNERTTVRNVPSRASGMLVRLAKYQGVYVLGNAITIGTQFALLASFELSPAVGVVVGAVVAYPICYLISMRFVWKL